MRPAIRFTILTVLAPSFLYAGIGTSSTQPPSATLDQRERQAATVPARAAEFSNIRRISSIPSCEDVQPPEPLTTPDPLLAPSPRTRKVKVSFIVGTDGRVHSPLILQSAGVAGDHRVLQTIRTWRYRPATCNGVPAETEGNVEFSSR
jgi:TonB family protein